MNDLYEIQYLYIKPDKKYDEIISKVVKECFRVENLLNSKLCISITLTTPENIQKYNKQYRDLDKPTDVLSFPMFEKEEIDKIISLQKKNLVPEPIGDIIISIDKVKEQAKEYGHSFERELSYMIVHGFYHIMGYDHIEEKDKLIMRPKEEKVLEILKQTR